MKKSDIYGWKSVFSFTFTQHYKNKGTIIALALLLIAIMAFGPIISLIAGSSEPKIISDLKECKIEEVYIKNQTDFKIDTDEYKKNESMYSKIKFSETDKSIDSFSESFKENSTKKLIADIYFDDEETKYQIDFYKSEESELSTITIEQFSETFLKFFDKSRIDQTGVSKDDIDLINAECSTDVITVSEINDNNSESKKLMMMSVTAGYACIIMILVLVSSQQIAASIIVEKSSKIMETLLLSVRPLAIIVGKVLGTMTVIICNFVLMIIAGSISAVITSVMNAGKIKDSFTGILESIDSSGGMESAASSSGSLVVDGDINVGRIFFGIIVIIITTVLAFVLYSVIAGISGASCKSMEDLGSANTFISICSMLGLYMAIYESMIDNRVFTVFTYIFPFSSMYIVPARYMFGEVGILYVLLMWVILALMITFMFRFAANIYHVLVLHNGERLKIKQLIELSKMNRRRGE